MNYRYSLVFLMFAIGCSQRSAGPTETQVAAPPAGVTEAKPRWKSLRRVVEQPGTVQAFEETQLFARVPGYIRKVHCDIGQKVQGPKYDSTGKETDPGQLLAEIFVPEL